MENGMHEWMQKAEVLIEALPYIQRFNRKIIVVKYGGSAMVDENIKKNVIKDVTLLKLVGFKPIIVHGGGKEISRWVGKVGMEAQFVNGLRVTDADDHGNRGDGAEQGKQRSGTDGGRAGCPGSRHQRKGRRPSACTEDVILTARTSAMWARSPRCTRRFSMTCWKKISCPSCAPSDMDDNFDTYNINADDAACAIARAVKAEKLAFLTDIEGVYRDPADKCTPDLRAACVGGRRSSSVRATCGGGMLPKLNNCIDAIENGVSRVHILDGRISHCLLLEIFTNKGIGTAILRRRGGKILS